MGYEPRLDRWKKPDNRAYVFSTPDRLLFMRSARWGQLIEVKRNLAAAGRTKSENDAKQMSAALQWMATEFILPLPARRFQPYDALIRALDLT